MSKLDRRTFIQQAGVLSVLVTGEGLCIGLVFFKYLELPLFRVVILLILGDDIICHA